MFFSPPPLPFVPPQAPSFPFVASFSSDTCKPSSGALTALAARVTAVDLRDKDVAGARVWAVQHVGIDAEDADILVKQKMDGEQLLKVTEEKLVKLYGMPGGPAGKIVDAIAAIVASQSAAAVGACRGSGCCVGGVGKRRAQV